MSTVTAGGVTNYRYFANNWLDKVTHANGTAAAYTYDGVGRMLSVQNTLANGNVLSSFAYAYDDNGNRTQQIETQNGFLTVQILTTNYVFDALDRLESYTETGSGKNTTHTFTYYPSYDRKTEKVVNNGITLKDRSYAYNGTYWLTGITETAGTGGSITYLYDDNGNSIRKTDTTSGSAQRTLFEYNSRNQLKRVAHGAPNAEVGQGTHDYNYAGMRIRHIGSERGDIEYIYDGDSILGELQNNTATLVAHYRYGDRLLSLVTGGSDQFYHYSALGTTANLTNSSGEQQVAYRTDAFGKITQQQGTSVNRHVFTGQEHDEKTGLIYFGARFYDPDTARFINQDTYLGESTTPPSLHRYLYAYSNPLYYTDPNGHCVFAIVDTMACLAIGAAAAGAAVWAWSAVFDQATTGAGHEALADPKNIKRGLATTGVIFSGGTLGVPATAGLFGVGGTMDVAHQTAVEGKSLSEVDYERVATSGGLTTLGGGTTSVALKSTNFWLNTAGKGAVVGFTGVGSYQGTTNVMEGVQNGNSAQVALGLAESALTVAGVRAMSQTQAKITVETSDPPSVTTPQRVPSPGDADFVGPIKTGFTPEEMAYYRKRTPNQEMRNAVNPEGPKQDPVYGYTVNRLEADHLVSFMEIMRMPGLPQLKPTQIVDVLNTPENFIGLGKSSNASKQDKTWTQWRGHSRLGPISENVRNNMLQKEADAQAALQRAIQQRLQENANK